MINVYLDDLRDVPVGYVLVKNIADLKDIFEKVDVNKLSLDHDLGENENGDLLETGYDFVKYFCEKGLYCKEIFIHTDNVVGRLNMYETLKGAQRRGFISKDIKIRHYSVTENKYTGY